MLHVTFSVMLTSCFSLLLRQSVVGYVVPAVGGPLPPHWTRQQFSAPDSCVPVAGGPLSPRWTRQQFSALDSCPFPITQPALRKPSLSLLRSLMGTTFSFPLSSTTKGRLMIHGCHGCKTVVSDFSTRIIIIQCTDPQGHGMYIQTVSHIKE